MKTNCKKCDTESKELDWGLCPECRQKIIDEFGLRPSGTPIDFPQELGYRCPKGHCDDRMNWSEFKDHIWCQECGLDYHYARDCFLVEYELNPKLKGEEQPPILKGYKNWMEDGNNLTVIPEKVAEDFLKEARGWICSTCGEKFPFDGSELGMATHEHDHFDWSHNLEAAEEREAP